MTLDDRRWRAGSPSAATGAGRVPEPELTPENASKVVATAAAAASRGSRHFAGWGPDPLAHPDPRWRAAVAEALEMLLAATVASLWGRGWQPSDLYRLTRKQSKWSAEVVSDAMVAELAGYPSARVDQRFWDQLDDLGARRWWPHGSGHLLARAGDRSWDRIVTGAVDAVGVLLCLPEVERHWPPPGEARARTDSAMVGIDDRILSRVRGLLAQAESTTFEEEAESFTAAAQTLMTRHSIDVALLAAKGERMSGDAPQGLRIGLENPYEQAKVMLLDVVARANNCRTVWSKQWSFSTVVGFPAQLIGVQRLFTSLLVQATAALGREGSRMRRDGSSRTRSFRASFLMSFAERIGERLQSATDAETAKADADAGQELLPILASRRRETEEAFERMFPQTMKVQSAMIGDHEGWLAGRAAADVARLAPGEEIGP